MIRVHHRIPVQPARHHRRHDQHRGPPLPQPGRPESLRDRDIEGIIPTRKPVLGQDLAREESNRDELVARLRQALPAPLAGAPGPLHVNVTRIAGAMPTEAGRELRTTADRVVALARSVRTAVTLGQRLVRYAQEALRAAVPTPRAQPPGYDRSARLAMASGAAGSLLDGRA